MKQIYDFEQCTPPVLNEQMLRAALERMQAWEADCTGLGPRADLASPGRQCDAETWPEEFARKNLALEVNVILQG